MSADVAAVDSPRKNEGADAQAAFLCLGAKIHAPDFSGFHAPILMADIGEIGTFSWYHFDGWLSDEWDRTPSADNDPRWHCDFVWHELSRTAVKCLVQWFGGEYGFAGNPTALLTRPHFVSLRWNSCLGGGAIVEVPSDEACGQCISCRSHARAPQSDPASWVYFVQAGDGGPVKIGRSNDPVGRRDALQTANPSRLKIIASMAGGGAVERSMHALFATDRIRPDGEWFTPSPALLAFAREIGGSR